MTKNSSRIKSVLYEVSLYLSEQADYEAKQLQPKVAALMNDEDFAEGKTEFEAGHEARIRKTICN